MTADQYQEFGRTGLFDPMRRLELLEGAIYDISPTGSRHAACVKRLMDLFHSPGNTNYTVSVQDSVRISDLSEPVPDVALLTYRADRYEESLPTADDVLLIVEVSDSTVRTDQTVKLRLYAIAAIPEFWLINLPEEKVEIYREPSNGAYTSITEARRGTLIAPSRLSGTEIRVEDILSRKVR